MSKETVLIAEDNALNLQLFTDLLEIKGVEVLQVADFSRVIEVAINGKPNLIITDIRLGVFSGVSLIKQIKDKPELRDIPIVAITAYATDEDRAELKKLGCMEYLSKPIPVNMFYEVVSKYIKF